MAENLPLVINQGEDWTVQIIWTDSFDEPLPVIHPCRMSIKSQAGQTLAELETDPDIPEGEVPTIALSSEQGLLQLHIAAEQTAAMPPGFYHYDLFVTLDAEDDFPGDQRHRLLYGQVTVNKRVTLV